MKLISLIGQRFGRLVVVAYAGRSTWLCHCDCGEEPIVRAYNLTISKTQSCGCLRDEILLARTGTACPTYRHGQSGVNETPTYVSFRNMHLRCSNNKAAGWKDYGGRGIKVCERWSGQNGFQNFLTDMGERPKGTSIDRFPNNDGNYEPENCRWATPKEQKANQRRKAA